MRKLLNTLYVTVPEAYLALDCETVLVLKEEEKLLRVPLHNLEGIITFGYTGVSPALMSACAKNNISLCFLTANGRFLARVVSESYGNVTLRKTQYRVSDDEEKSAVIAKNFIIGKTYNSKWVIERAMRDHSMVLDMEEMKEASSYLSETLEELKGATGLEEIRGLEGKAASIYFSVFDSLILQQKEYFYWRGRSRRPPMDNINALLSFAYTLLANDCSSALEAVGLDAYVGFLHRDRPGRISLALDLMGSILLANPSWTGPRTCPQFSADFTKVTITAPNVRMSKKFLHIKLRISLSKSGFFFLTSLTFFSSIPRYV
jgi:CRISPR-associated protein Cas1